MDNRLLFRDECYAIQGAVFEVYREMGCGILEAIYQECLEKEFLRKGIPHIAQQELRLSYKGEELNQFYKPDFICYGEIIVELKALRELAGEHRSRILNYLKCTGKRLGLLVNFGSPQKAVVERIIS